MAQDLANTIATTGRPSTLSQAARERISLTHSRLMDVGGRLEVVEANAPTAVERRAMRGRLADLAVSMAPAGDKAIEGAIGKLLAGIPAGIGHKEAPERVIAMFVQALRDLPAWSISSACAAWNRGEYPGYRAEFARAPVPADLRNLALAATEEFDRERQQIKAVLAAEVVPEPESDETRARVVAKVRQWLDERDPKAAVSGKLTEDEFDAWAVKFRDKVRTDTAPLSSLAKHAAGLIDAAAGRRAQDDMDEPGRQFPAEQNAEERS